MLTVFSMALSAFAQVPVSEWDNFVSTSDGSWYQFDATNTNIPNGFVSEANIENAFNASDAFMGLKYNNTRFKYESNVPELGIPGLLAFTPTGANNANYQERIAVPKTKDKDYTPAREVAVRMDYFMINPGPSKTNNVAQDIRTYYPEPHVKRNGLSTYLEQPGPGSNPGPTGEGCEFVLLSQYGPDTYTNNFPYGNKGDVYGQTLPQGFTTFDLNGTYESFDPKSPTYTKDRTVFAVGVYGHDITDYNYQSQIYPCYPGTNIRLTVPSGELIQNRFLIGLNTVTNGVSNKDGYFHWWMKIPSINNGQWFLAATLVNRNFTGDLAMQLANLGIGQYNGGNGKGYYLNDGKTANGLWYSNMSVYYKNGGAGGGGGSTGSNNAPVVSLTSPKDGAIFNPGDNVPLVAAASDSDGSIAKVEFIRDGLTVLGTELQAPYNIDWTNVPTGTYTLTAKATDNQGAITLSLPITITVLNQNGQNPPVVSLTSPANGTQYNLGDDILMTASASDPDGTIAKVEFWAGNTLLFSDGAAPYQYKWVSPTSGTYNLKVVAVDNAALTTTSSVATVTVKGPNAGPAVTIIKPGVNAQFSQGDNVSIEATATDSDGSIAKVEFYAGSQLITTEKNAPYEATITNIQAGTYTLTAVATDNDGKKTTSVGVPITVVLGSGGSLDPTVSFIEPLDGAVYQKGDKIEVEAVASQPGGSIARVVFYINGTKYKTEYNAAYEAPLLNVQPGSYTLMAIAYDNLGSSDTATVDYTVAGGTTGGGGTGSGTKPSVSFIKPLDGANFPVGSDVDVEALASDPDGKISKVKFFLDGVQWRTEKVFPYTGRLKSMQAGTYKLMAVGIDDSGQTDSTTITFTVGGGGGSGAQAPIVEVVNPLDGQVFKIGSTVKVDVNASDPDGTISKVEIFVDSDLIQIEKNYPYEASQLFVLPGTYVITAVAYDNSGLSTVSDKVTITVKANTSSLKGLFFDAIPDAGLIILSWGAQEEEGVEEFRITKSSDSLLYQKLYEVPAVGTSTTPTSYNDIDPDPFGNVSWYKLEAVATDGSVLETIIVRVDLTEPDILQKWIVYPNPLSGNKPIKIWAALTQNVDATVEINSVYGAAIYSTSFQFVAGTNKKTIGLETLPPGIYFFTLRMTQTGTVLDTKLFIKTP